MSAPRSWADRWPGLLIGGALTAAWAVLAVLALDYFLAGAGP